MQNSPYSNRLLKSNVNNLNSTIVSERNKENAIAFYKMAYEGNPKEAVEKYVGKEYIQHNPDVADETKGFIEYFERMQQDYLRN